MWRKFGAFVRNVKLKYLISVVLFDTASLVMVLLCL